MGTLNIKDMFTMKAEMKTCNNFLTIFSLVFDYSKSVRLKKLKLRSLVRFFSHTQCSTISYT